MALRQLGSFEESDTLVTSLSEAVAVSVETTNQRAVRFRSTLFSSLKMRRRKGLRSARGLERQGGGGYSFSF